MTKESVNLYDRERMLKAANGYVDLGFYVIPLWPVNENGKCGCGKADCKHPGKHPNSKFAPHGLKDATRDSKKISLWFGNCKPMNIGIRTGAESRIVVLDIDYKEGGDESIKCFRIPQKTPCVKTGGGLHYYFKHPGEHVKSLAKAFGPGLDCKADGGYVVAPPSRHHTGKEYLWKLDPRAGLPDMPKWMFNVKAKNKMERHEDNESIPEGQRDTWLTSIAGGLRRQGCSFDTIFDSLCGINKKRCAPPLSEAQVKKIAVSVCNYEPGNSTKLDFVTLASIAPEPIEWFWPNKIPTGAVTILAGDPGTGKSYLTHYIAAQVTRGATWPDCPTKPTIKGSVIFFADEDDPAKVIRPRLDAHRANVSKVLILDKVLSGDDREFFDVGKHLDGIDLTLKKIRDCKLIVFDPITAYLGRSNANAEVRAVLTPLAALAAKHNVTIIGINHLNKRADLSYMYRGLGSQAFIAQARSAWAVILDPDDRESRIFAPIKSNYCVEPTGLKFRIIDGVVMFENDPWTGHVDDKGQEKKSRVDETATWLQQRLESGAVLSTTIFDEAKEKGFNRDLCYRAKERLNVRATKDGFGCEGKWSWELIR